MLHPKFWSHSRLRSCLEKSKEFLEKNENIQSHLTDIQVCDTILLRCIAKAYGHETQTPSVTPRKTNSTSEDVAADLESTTGLFPMIFGGSSPLPKLLFDNDTTKIIDSGDTQNNSRDRRMDDALPQSLPQPLPISLDQNINFNFDAERARGVKDIVTGSVVFDIVRAIFSPSPTTTSTSAPILPCWRRAHAAYALVLLLSYDSGDSLLAKLSELCQRMAPQCSSAKRQAFNTLVVQVRLIRIN